MTDSKALADALAALSSKSKMDLVGPTADDDIRRAIARHGAKAVTEAIRRQIKPKKPGPVGVLGDLPELRAVFEADARDWLNGGDPFVTRTPYSIAKEFADNNPGHSYPATMKRITRKLSTKRVLITLITAEAFGKYDYPHCAYLRTVKALIERVDAQFYGYVLTLAESQIADYETKTGEPPARELSMRDIETAIRNAFSPKIDPDTGGFRGLFGLADVPLNAAAE